MRIHPSVDATHCDVEFQVDTEVSDSLSESSEFGPCLGVYCLNCSERRHGTVCERCGHDSQSCPLDLMPSLNCIWSGSEADQDVAIVYDERMMLHDKGDGRPHPERPDRLKAIMARLMKSGLAGRLSTRLCVFASRLHQAVACLSTTCSHAGQARGIHANN